MVSTQHTAIVFNLISLKPNIMTTIELKPESVSDIRDCIAIISQQSSRIIVLEKENLTLQLMIPKNDTITLYALKTILSSLKLPFKIV